MLIYRVLAVRELTGPYLARVPIEATVLRDSEPSNDFLLELRDPLTNAPLAIFTPLGSATQWFDRESIYREVLAQAYEFSEPRMGVIRWPTLSETSGSLSFNVTEADGGSSVPTVPAKAALFASVGRQQAVREAVVIERMDDGQWRIAGYGASESDALATLDLQVTTSGVLYAVGLDHYGEQFMPFAPAGIGQRIRPSRFAGWLYEITQAGVLPEIEPQWWPIEGDNPSRALGTARAIAVRYYRPLALGPVTVEML